jgi:hypothetical protein
VREGVGTQCHLSRAYWSLGLRLVAVAAAGRVEVLGAQG